jgi:hypothetical protein
MRSSNLKVELHNELQSQVEAFLAKNGKIVEVPSNIYRHEEITQRDRCTIMQTTEPRRNKAKKGHGQAMKEVDRMNWEQRKIKEGKL